MSKISEAIIKIKMPATCYDCEFLRYNDSKELNICGASGDYLYDNKVRTERHKDCPLVEIKEDSCNLCHSNLYICEACGETGLSWDEYKNHYHFCEGGKDEQQIK